MNIHKIINDITCIRDEENNLLKFVNSLNLSPEQKILDVGCGFGSKLEILRSHGFNVIGVEVNQETVATNLTAGINCMTVEEFINTNELYDVLLMSHIIEHLQPDDLLKFMDNYLNRLKPGGYLIVATPLFSSYFYEDFDHVKPYHPTSINQLFGNNSAQVQYYSKNKIELLDIWFRRGPFKLIFAPGLYLKKYSKVPILVNIFLTVLFRLSFGYIGKTNGWMGLYKKLHHSGIKQ